MSAIAAVLLVPTEGSDLLREGPCGARPPMVAEYQNAHGTSARWEWSTEHGWLTHRHALVLAWEGEVVVEGMDRLYRCLGARPEFMNVWSIPHTILQAYNSEGRQPGEHSWGGALILLDADGKETP